MPYYIVQPYADGPDRFRHATVVSSHATVEEAFTELERISARLHEQHLPPHTLELFIVDERRTPVRIGH